MIPTLKKAGLILGAVVTAFAIGIGGRYAYEGYFNGGQDIDSLCTQCTKATKDGIDQEQHYLMYRPPDSRQDLKPSSILRYFCKERGDEMYTDSSGTELTIGSYLMERRSEDGGNLSETITWKHWGRDFVLQSRMTAHFSGERWDVEQIDHNLTTK